MQICWSERRKMEVSVLNVSITIVIELDTEFTNSLTLLYYRSTFFVQVVTHLGPCFDNFTSKIELKLCTLGNSENLNSNNQEIKVKVLFCFASTFSDKFNENTPYFLEISYKTKTLCDLESLFTFEFLLVHCVVLVCCDWYL